jgi:CHASE2 domain/Adenylate and Guanylate cyclase catalytic domain
MSPCAWWRVHRARLLQLWGVGIACSLLVTGALALGYLEFLQDRTLDLLLHVQGQRFPSEVVIVAIDDAAFESLGRRQPLPRAYLAQLLQGVRRSGDSVVGLATLRMGIGPHTGEVFAGNVGGAAKLKYAVVGDPVNVTARLESLNKDLGTTILMTVEMCTILGDWVETRDCGETSVKGRTQPLHVYEVLTV